MNLNHFASTIMKPSWVNELEAFLDNENEAFLSNENEIFLNNDLKTILSNAKC